MNFSMPQYECKFNDKERWEDVSESDVLIDLNEFYGMVTPEIQQIIKGKHVRTSIAVYRLKIKE
jgi:hypothetical protein